MESLFSLFPYGSFGFFGFLILLVVLALVFGRRVRKRREFEAEFRSIGGTQFGEFDIQVSKVAKEEPEYSFKARFRMQHESLVKGQLVQVYLGDLLIMQGNVTRAGRILLRERAGPGAIQGPEPGQVCRVVWGGIEQFRAPLKPD